MLVRLSFALLTFAWLCVAQTPLNFDVASIRPSGEKPPSIPGGGILAGGPGTPDPTRLRYTWVPARRLLMEAFALPDDQVSVADWIMGARFDVVANVPEGATKDQAREMLLSLLKNVSISRIIPRRRISTSTRL